MAELSTLWITGIGALLIGGLIGMWIGRRSPAAKRSETLHQELSETRRELESYKAEVNSHFSETAALVNKLTESYRDVHQHLAQSANRLCEEEGLLKSLQAPEVSAVERQPEVPQKPEEDAFNPPRDYAPPRDPEQAGTLSESYGLDRKAANAEQPPHDPSRTADHAPR
ncbi:YhcB family protein [Motiliproteus sp. SC1-56]|uniref:YhcB family protein n=1 Tax=Motiliproteus sp. SC1-56 TaxID=2799565 RepID=UPI001A8DDDEE|nr:DUF1043 family protein [Motiliproteus sp. SC1-56]